MDALLWLSPIARNNLGSLVQGFAASATVTVAGLAPAVVTGLTLDRQLLLDATTGRLGLAPGACFCACYTANLSQGHSVAISNAFMETSADGINWITIFDQTGAVAPIPVGWVASGTTLDTGAAGGNTVHGVLTFGVDLGPAQRYVRFNFTANLTGAADSAQFACLAEMISYGA